MRAKTAIIVVTLIVSGCSDEPQRGPSAESPRAEAAVPPADAIQRDGVTINPYRGEAGLDSFTWSHGRTHDKRKNPTLFYGGRSETAIGMRCRNAGAVALHLIRDNAPDVTRDIVIASYPEVISLAPKLDAPGAQNEVIARAELPIDAPVLRRFRSTGLLTINGPGGPRQMDAIDEAEKAAVAQFFVACERPSQDAGPQD